MSVSLNCKENCVSFVFEGKVSIEDATVLLRYLIVNMYYMVSIDMEGVDSMDKTAMHILRLVYDTIREYGGILSVVNVSEKLNEELIVGMPISFARW